MSFNEYWQAEQQRRAVAEAIAALRPGEPQNESRFYEALRQATLLLPVTELPEGMQSGELLVGQKQVRVTMVQGPNQQLYLPLFTSEENLHRAHPPDAPHILLPFPPIVEMVQNAQVAGIVIDHAGPASAAVPLATLAAVVRGEAPPAPEAAPTTTSQVPANQLRVGPMPRVVSQHEVNALARWLQQQAGVTQAYLFGLNQMGPQSQPVLTVGMGFSQFPPQTHIEQLAQQVGGLLGPSGIVVLDGRLLALLAQQVGVIRFDLVGER